MPRKALIRSKRFPYHVFNRVNNREWFPLNMNLVWRLFSEECFRITSLTDAQIHSFVLMSNHYHMLISTPGPDLGLIMQEFGRSVTKTFNLETGRSGHLFGGRYKWTLVDNPIYYSHVYKYVYRNPVRAELVGQVEDYQFSTLNGLLGQSHLPFPLYVPGDGAGCGLIPETAADQLLWLNKPFKKEHEEAIRLGLRRLQFELPRLDPYDRMMQELEVGLI
jgi:putative transposase